MFVKETNGMTDFDVRQKFSKKDIIDLIGRHHMINKKQGCVMQNQANIAQDIVDNLVMVNVGAGMHMNRHQKTICIICQKKIKYYVIGLRFYNK